MLRFCMKLYCNRDGVVSLVGKMSITCKIVVAIPDGKRPLGRHRYNESVWSNIHLSGTLTVTQVTEIFPDFFGGGVGSGMVNCHVGNSLSREHSHFFMIYFISYSCVCLSLTGVFSLLVSPTKIPYEHLLLLVFCLFQLP